MGNVPHSPTGANDKCITERMNIMENKQKKCYIYTRVSTEMQIDGYSLEAQKNRLYKEAKYRKMKVIEEFSDEGKSGKNIKGRPEFQKMLNKIQAGTDKVDYVLVFKLSRFGRNTADTMNSLQLMEDFGVNLLSVEDNIDSGSASGKMMISVVASVSEMERENIKEQTMAGREQKARNGRWNGGFAPYGYKLKHKDGSKGGELVINEEEAPLIRLIFDKYSNTTMGISGVAKWLNENNYTKVIRQNGTVELMSAHFIKGILDNPVYKGKIAYGRRRNEKIEGTRNEYHVIKQSADSYEINDGKHEAIISEEEWDYAHKKRLKNAFKREKTHSLEHEHILSGIVKCPVCGAPMYGAVNRKKKKGSDEYYRDMWYYICKNRKSQSGKLCTYKTHVKQDIINMEVEALVRWVLSDSDFKDGVLARVGSNDNLSEKLHEEERLKKEKQKLEKGKAKILSKISALDIDDDLYDELYDNLQSVLREQIQKIKRAEDNITENAMAIDNARGGEVSAEVYIEIMDEILRSIGEMPDEEEKKIMQCIIERVDIFPEKQEDGRWVQSIQFKIPLNINGEIYDMIDLSDNYSSDKIFPPLGTQDETCVLLSHKNS